MGSVRLSRRRRLGRASAQILTDLYTVLREKAASTA